MIDARNVILTGLPRSGSTLTCHLLNKLPDTVALHEPMRGTHVKGHTTNEARRIAIQDFFAGQRETILNEGRAWSRTAEGALPANPFAETQSDTGLRKHLDSRGDIIIDRPLSPDFMLAVKHIASFTALLGDLIDWFPVYAVIRNPLATLASWWTLDAPLRRGNLGPATIIDGDLRAKMEPVDDPLERQLILLDWFFAQFRRHLPERSIIRYESMIETDGRCLEVIRPEAAGLSEPLTSRNVNKLYDRDHMLRVGELLLATDGAYWEFYDRERVRDLMAEVEASAEPGPPESPTPAS